jgi:hypothetical protein
LVVICKHPFCFRNEKKILGVVDKNKSELIVCIICKRLQNTLNACVLNASLSLLVFEQLIEDLTQEKFSLQRALDTSKSIADTLAVDHASITENYNQQVGPRRCFFILLY